MSTAAAERDMRARWRRQSLKCWNARTAKEDDWNFLASKLSFTIDGFTHPSSTDRYCLGMFSNIQRTEAIEAARHNIGSGVRFTKEGGDI